ncbi:restriction endonuclease subunit S [Helicobacter pylori]|nr:restriction endonuclease subunit S [Helicobacter pylori]
MDALMLPSNWQKVRLGDILSYEQPTKFLVATTQYLQKGFTPILTAGKTFILGYTNDKHGIYTNIPVIIFDDFTTDSKMVNFPFKVKSSAIKILSLRDNNQADLKYIYEKLTLLKHQVTDHKRYWIDEFSNIEILLPPLNEQIAIANILSDLDHYLYSLDALILKKEGVKKALSFELLSQRKRLKGFNQNWQRVRLGDIAEINPPTIIPNVFYYIDLESVEKGQLLNKQLMTKNKAPSRARRLLSKNDILYQLVRPYQRNNYFFTLNGNYVASTGYAQIRTLQNPSFLYFALHSNYFVNAVLDRCEGTSYPAISSNELKKCEVILPPLDEQIAIANILSGLDHEIASLKNKKRQFDNIKKALNHDLMSAKIRVLKKISFIPK